MSLLQELMKENVTTANAVNAGGGHDTGPGGSLFKGGIVKRKNTLQDAYRLDPSTVKVPRTNWGWRILGEMADTVGSLSGQGEESSFDPADVMSKLKKAEKQVDAEDDTVTYGMEDEDGKVVKVYVRSEQADEFEAALAGMLAGEQEGWTGLGCSNGGRSRIRPHADRCCQDAAYSECPHHDGGIGRMASRKTLGLFQARNTRRPADPWCRK